MKQTLFTTLVIALFLVMLPGGIPLATADTSEGAELELICPCSYTDGSSSSAIAVAGVINRCKSRGR